MKKVILLSTVVAGLTLASCGGHSETEVVAADSVAVAVDTTVVEVVDSAEVLVGVSTGTIALPSGRESWDSSDAVNELVSSSCRFISPLPGEYSDLVSLYRCPSSVLVKGIS